MDGSKNNKKNIRVRFGGSPTGNLHIGSVRTILYNYALAKKNNGKFIYRPEDTDRKRYVVGAIHETYDILKRFDLDPDLGPDKKQIEASLPERTKGKFYENDWILHAEKLEKINDDDFDKIYIQSLRIPLYQKYALKLIKEGFAYLCFCTQEKLDKMRKEQQKKKIKVKYDGFCKKYSYKEAIEKVKKGEKFVVRLNVAAYAQSRNLKRVEYIDPLLGKMKFPLIEVDDQVLIKSDGIPTYHLAVVVDDHLMEISDPLRGWEWIASTPKQVMLYDLLGWEMPRYLHLTAILDPDGGKLSKRKGSVAAMDFFKKGYLPEAVLNFLMRLGWSPRGEDRELFTLEEFVKKFDLKDLNKSNPVFDRKKLDWFSGYYIRALNIENFEKRFLSWVKDFAEDNNLKKDVLNDKDLQRKLKLLQERAKIFSEVLESLEFFYQKMILPEFSKIKGIKKYSKNECENIITEYKELFKEYSDKSLNWTHEKWEADVRNLAEKNNWKAGDLFMLIRLYICGSPFSPPLFESMQILQKKECLERLDIKE